MQPTPPPPNPRSKVQSAFDKLKQRAKRLSKKPTNTVVVVGSSDILLHKMPAILPPEVFDCESLRFVLFRLSRFQAKILPGFKYVLCS